MARNSGKDGNNSRIKRRCLMQSKRKQDPTRHVGETENIETNDTENKDGTRQKGSKKRWENKSGENEDS